MISNIATGDIAAAKRFNQEEACQPCGISTRSGTLHIARLTPSGLRSINIFVQPDRLGAYVKIEGDLNSMRPIIRPLSRAGDGCGRGRRGPH
jgi:hypothetical protein